MIKKNLIRFVVYGAAILVALFMKQGNTWLGFVLGALWRDWVQHTFGAESERWEVSYPSATASRDKEYAWVICSPDPNKKIEVYRTNPHHEDAKKFEIFFGGERIFVLNVFVLFGTDFATKTRWSYGVYAHWDQALDTLRKLQNDLPGKVLQCVPLPFPEE